MLLLYMALGLIVHAARRQKGTLAKEKDAFKGDDHKEFDQRKLNRKNNLNTIMFKDNGDLKPPPAGHFYMSRWGTKWLHIKPVGRFKGDGVVYWALDTPTPLKWLSGGMIQVGGKFAPITKGVAKAEKKKTKPRLCLQWRKSTAFLPRFAALSPWGVEFVTGPCPQLVDEDDNKIMSNRNENYMFACGQWPVVGNVFGRRVDIEGRDMNKISQGYEMVVEMNDDGSPEHEKICPPQALLFVYQTPEDIWIETDNLLDPQLDVVGSGPEEGMLIFDSSYSKYFSVMYDTASLTYKPEWVDNILEATLWTWRVVQWKKNALSPDMKDKKSVITTLDPHMRLGRHNICLKWISRDFNKGVFDIQPCNKRMEKFSFGCAQKHGVDYFGLMNDAKRKRISKMATHFSDPMSGKSVCNAFAGYKALAQDKWNAFGAESFIPEDICVHKDPDWVNEDGAACRTLLRQKTLNENGDWNQEAECQKSDSEDEFYAYEVCNCLECEPVVCDGHWDVNGCSEVSGWGENKQQVQYISDNPPWPGKTCPYDNDQQISYHSMECPFIQDCEGNWEEIDACEFGQKLMFYKVTQMALFSGEGCEAPPSTRKNSANPC